MRLDSSAVFDAIASEERRIRLSGEDFPSGYSMSIYRGVSNIICELADRSFPSFTSKQDVLNTYLPIRRVIERKIKTDIKKGESMGLFFIKGKGDRIQKTEWHTVSGRELGDIQYNVDIVGISDAICSTDQDITFLE